MTSNQPIFSGVHVSSGRKPITFAALDEDLNLLELCKWTVTDLVFCLQEYETIVLAIHAPAGRLGDINKIMTQAGLKQAVKQGPRLWMRVDAQQCFQTLCEQDLLSRRSIEGRIQRALILYNERIRIHDPMDFFEEITRHKLLRGILPLEKIYSVRELDALMAAYTAWVYRNEPGQVRVLGNTAILQPRLEE